MQIYFSSMEKGVGPASLSLFVSATPYSSDNPAEATKGQKELKTTYDKHGDVNVFTSADLYVSFPVEHPLAREPAQMLSWVRQLQLVREGRFSSGSCGLALNCDIISGGVQFAMEPRLAVLCQQYPGLEFHLSSGVMRLLRYNGRTGRILHKVRRASWLTLLSGNCVEQLGGLDKLRAKLGEGPALLHTLENKAVLLQAGPEPRLGDLSQRDFLPAYRQVARAIRPIRLEQLERTPTGAFADWVQDWLETFDREPA
ncbi:type VI immunity family protein [Archangium minus]|uniref:type VI immunity family protein n=1 Tax=Archangium minus TaxID=83450 RepID=UPI0037C0BB18